MRPIFLLLLLLTSVPAVDTSGPDLPGVSIPVIVRQAGKEVGKDTLAFAADGLTLALLGRLGFKRIPYTCDSSSHDASLFSASATSARFSIQISGMVRNRSFNASLSSTDAKGVVTVYALEAVKTGGWVIPPQAGGESKAGKGGKR